MFVSLSSFRPFSICTDSPSLLLRSEFVSLGTVYVSFQALPSHLPPPSSPCLPRSGACLPVCAPPCVCAPHVFLCVPPFLSLALGSPLPAPVDQCRARTPSPPLPLSIPPGSPAPHLRPGSLLRASVSSLENWADTPTPHLTHSPRGRHRPRPRSGEFGPGSRRKGSEPRPAALRWGRVREAPLLALPLPGPTPNSPASSGRIKVAALPLHRSVTSALPLSVGSTSFGHLRRHGFRRHLQGEPPN